MRRLVLLACLGFLAFAVSAAPLPESARPAPGTHAARPVQLVDRDGDRVSDGLQAAVGAARAGELFRVVVTFRGPGNAATARQAVGFFVVHREFKIVNGFSATMTAAQVRALARQPGVFRIEEDFPVSVKLDAARRDFGADAARTGFEVSGAGIRGCIVDTGVDPRHEQLSRVVAFKDLINGQASAYDDHGHGTHVASIAFGDGTGAPDSLGADKYKGVAPGVEVYAAKVLDRNGSGLESDVIAGIDWCVDQGAHIISMSLGSSAPSDGTDTLSRAADAAVGKGSVVVAAAGNSGDEPGTVGSPGAAAQVITVGACAERSAPAGSPNHSDGIYLTPFSSRGPTLDNRIKPDVCAPGHSVTAAQVNTVGGYVTYSGTSMATPFVAGAVALALQAYRVANPLLPPLPPTDVRQKLEATAQDRGASGKDSDLGAGLVDVYAFVASAKGNSSYQSTAFPTYRRISASVANHGLWTHSFNIAPSDLGIPIGIAITINGQTKCVLPFLGSCLAAQWDPDLDAKLIGPDGALLSASTCMAGDDCGGIGRQETLHAMPIGAGSYTIQVFPSEDSVNMGKGGSFFVDISTGPLASVASNAGVHVGDLDASSTSGKSGWTATIAIMVHDANHVPVSGATVSGAWSGGFSGNSSCTTGVTGQCSLASGNISKRKTSATFSVSSITGALPYQPASNHDPDGDSNGSAITASKQ